MPFQAFHDLLPEVAEEETRAITILESSPRLLPAGNYKFIEQFCNEHHCDCRRVFFNVTYSSRPGCMAVIAYGWESDEFYINWMYGDDNDHGRVDDIKGPNLTQWSQQSDLASNLLDLFKEDLLPDKKYIERVKRHYKMFRGKIDNQVPKKAIRKKIGRNSPCECGSGKKYKKCCG